MNMKEISFHPSASGLFSFPFKLGEHETCRPALQSEPCVLPEAGRSVLQNSSLHAVSMKMLLNLLSNEATYFARGWEPGHKKKMFIFTAKMKMCIVFWLVFPITLCTNPDWHTYGDHQEANVTEPVRCLVGQLLHEEPQDGAEVTLVACHCHLHRRRGLCVAVAAAGVKVRKKESY